LLPLAVSLCGLLFSLVGSPTSPLLGRYAAELGDHTVIVTDCFRLTMPTVVERESTAGETIYTFAPCRDVEVVIADDLLRVNGALYGALNPASVVLVSEPLVFVNGMERLAQPAPQ
jgi:hypothetical protein